MACLLNSRVPLWSVLYVILTSVSESVYGNIRYSIPEELELGAFVGNIVKDLGLDVKHLLERRFRIASESNKQHLTVNLKTGFLQIKEKIDREQLCEQGLSCVLMLEAMIDNPLQIYRIEVDILDINDHAPVFRRSEVDLEISEMTPLGTSFPLESAADPDAGTNSVRSYQLNSNEYFGLKSQSEGGETGVPELVLQRQLDREQEPTHRLTLTAFDGGNPERFGTIQIKIIVVDANDNAPVCQQNIYQVTTAENTPRDALIVKVTAVDKDEGLNGEVIYSFSDHTPDKVRQIFSLEAATGEIRLKGNLDFEETHSYQISVQAKDRGPHQFAVYCKVLVIVTDINDNSPEIIATSTSSTISENASPHSAVAVLRITDRDSENTADVYCTIPREIPFKLTTSFKNYYTLVTQGDIDRENVPEYNITIICTDAGHPPLSTAKTIRVLLTDINDNAPRFTQPSFTIYVTENNVIGASIGAVSAFDPDSKQNAELSYSLFDSQIHGLPALTFVSINAVSGEMSAHQSFDFEQLTSFEVHVRVRDSGSPPLSSNVTVNVIIVDQNDNAPVIVSPSPIKGSAAEDNIPRSAEPGYLVAKVTATDADSGLNAQLVYQLYQPTDESLFTVAPVTGELWTIRHFTRKDPIRTKVVVLVRDNGIPSLSSTITINVSVQDDTTENGSSIATLGTSGPLKLDLKFFLMILFGTTSFVLLVAILFLGIKVCKGRDCINNGFCCWSTSYLSQTSSHHGIQKASVNLQIPSNYTQAYENATLPRQLHCDPAMNDLMFLKLHGSAGSLTDLKTGTCVAAKNEKALISARKDTTNEIYGTRQQDLEQSTIERCSSGQYGIGLYTSEKYDVGPDPRRLVEIHSRAF
ncbi:protocadherin-10-like isoform X33 [Scyliorhinus canicula]|uniref:protocadherin-10-like isoform X33 n=1 Tax=Scyliorhinus canicula TaxID=7830 RepID=UPI0018F76461|nr:protocadherin-10-like isoform X33 [Scyliorhinus canicula]